MVNGLGSGILYYTTRPMQYSSKWAQEMLMMMMIKTQSWRIKNQQRQRNGKNITHQSIGFFLLERVTFHSPFVWPGLLVLATTLLPLLLIPTVSPIKPSFYISVNFPLFSPLEMERFKLGPFSNMPFWFDSLCFFVLADNIGKKYSNVLSNVMELQERGCLVFHGVDA